MKREGARRRAGHSVWVELQVPDLPDPTRHWVDPNNLQVVARREPLGPHTGNEQPATQKIFVYKTRASAPWETVIGKGFAAAN